MKDFLKTMGVGLLTLIILLIIIGVFFIIAMHFMVAYLVIAVGLVIYLLGIIFKDTFKL